MYERREWDRFARRAGPTSLQQSWGYGQAMQATGRRVERFAIGEDAALAQVIDRPILGPIGLALLNRGPILAPGRGLDEVSEPLTREVRARFGRRFFLWSPDRPDAPPQLGRALVTGYATAWLDLAPDVTELRAGLHGKWRGHLNRAERQKLVVRTVNAGSLVGWLGARHLEHRQRIGFRALPVRFMELLALQSPGCRDRLVLAAEQDGEPVAGIWLQAHHGSATYLVGYASEAGRRADAMRLLLWHGMLALKERGVRWLDLGGVATDRAPQLSSFKFGLGARGTVEAGTYLLSPLSMSLGTRGGRTV